MKSSQEAHTPLYAKVVMPLKLRKTISYLIPSHLQVEVGSRVVVPLRDTTVSGVITEVTSELDCETNKVKEIIQVENLPLVKKTELLFWQAIADYYMCTLGEVFKAASPYFIEKGNDTSKSTPLSNKCINLNILTPPQLKAFEEIKYFHSSNKTVLLNGVTGSGKTEIYIHLIKECLDRGQNSLYLLPEVAICRQIEKRLKKVFGDHILTYHSKETISKKRNIIDIVSNSDKPYIIIGLRSSLFLPFRDLGLIIVDEEHDSSYKQNDPAPRYNGRDAAIILSKIHNAKIVLGSATPSFESEYNVKIGKYAQVNLATKYNDSSEPPITIVDMQKERKNRGVKGLFSFIMINEIRKRLENKEQVMVFRGRRAYSPTVQCSECGEIPKCKNCNVPLTFHKFNNSLVCHYCGYSKKLNPSIEPSETIGNCPSCGVNGLRTVGSGTEKIEEELKKIFPEASIARFDADTTRRKGEGEKLLKEFSKGEIDILVGTQMISKGFDFGNLTLVAVIQSETITAVNDFRCDEKAIRLLNQLRGRSGRGSKEGMLLIQTSQADHPVYKFISGEVSLDELLIERREFEYPPYTRIINITIKDRIQEGCKNTAEVVKNALTNLSITSFTGPIPPPIDKIQREYLLRFVIKLNRDKNIGELKKSIYSAIDKIGKNIIIDVDPS